MAVSIRHSGRGTGFDTLFSCCSKMRIVTRTQMLAAGLGMRIESQPKFEFPMPWVISQGGGCFGS